MISRTFIAAPIDFTNLQSHPVDHGTGQNIRDGVLLPPTVASDNVLRDPRFAAQLRSWYL
jgi:hypothetical protein